MEKCPANFFEKFKDAKLSPQQQKHVKGGSGNDNDESSDFIGMEEIIDA